jgi:hypothetical protein
MDLPSWWDWNVAGVAAIGMTLLSGWLGWGTDWASRRRWTAPATLAVVLGFIAGAIWCFTHPHQ